MVGESGVFGIWIDGSADPVEALSPRLRQVAEFAAAGATATEIGETLELSTHTVRGYLKDVYRRLGVANRVELSARLRARNGHAS
jgi:DNA-binding NarL/FixJ family response regulator